MHYTHISAHIYSCGATSATSLNYGREALHGLEDGLGLRHGLEAWGREGWLGLRHGGEGWLGLSNGKKRYSVRLENKSQKNQKIVHFRAPLGDERFFEFLRFVFKFYQLPLFFPLLSPSHPSLPHASSPCLKPSPSSSPCLKPMPSPWLKPMPQAHLFPLIRPYSNRISG